MDWILSHLSLSTNHLQIYPNIFSNNAEGPMGGNCYASTQVTRLQKINFKACVWNGESSHRAQTLRRSYNFLSLTSDFGINNYLIPYLKNEFETNYFYSLNVFIEFDKIQYRNLWTNPLLDSRSARYFFFFYFLRCKLSAYSTAKPILVAWTLHWNITSGWEVEIFTPIQTSLVFSFICF